ncbi:replication initiator protein A [Staphylococcus cohnii subsp. cohnii]|uniref:replication initiator protein A n=1 Tax=Staphylococcus TaxID=1279 RepID=UPI001AEC42D3|nr:MULTISPECIES: replication initiator protein A [Staphylococcus]MEB8071618.1 replication initiator protein A [Staphylococcus xylosus]MEB8090763.1 replication initiator protein A [Staphylococcus saprophyticus]
MSRKNIKNQASQNFYMLHKVLFINEKYKKLSDSAKVTYAILNDRVSLSIKNNWIDQNGDIYFIFTNENLQEVLDKSKNTITKIKKELQEVGLLEQVKTGFNRPNKLYLHEIETNINIEKEIQNSTSNNDESSDSKDSQIMGAQNPKQWEPRIPNNGSPESQNLDPNDTDLSNTDYIETENNDTYDMNDTYNNSISHDHSDHTNHQQTEFNNDALKFQVLEELPQQLQGYLSKFEIREIRIIKSVLLKGKKSFNNAHDTYYRLEDVEFEIISVLKRFKAMLLQKNETVEAMQGYLMQSIKAELEEIHALNMRRQNMKQHNIFNQ